MTYNAILIETYGSAVEFGSNFGLEKLSLGVSGTDFGCQRGRVWESGGLNSCEMQRRGLIN